MLFLSNTLFSKLTRLMIIMILISLFSSLMVLFTVKRSYESSFNENFLDTVKLAVTFLELELDSISEMSLSLSTTSKIQENFKMLSRQDTDYEGAQVRQEIEKDMYLSAFSKPYISIIEADILGYDTIPVGRNLGIDKQFKDRPSLASYEVYNGKDHYHSIEGGILINSREIRDVSSLDFFPLGTLHVYLDVDRMMEYFSRRITYLDHVTIHVFYKGQLLSRKSDRLVPPIDILHEGSKQYMILDRGNESFFATYIKGRQEGMEYVAVRNLKDYHEVNNRLTRILIITQILIVLLLFTGSRRYVRGITKPLVRLSQKISVFELQNFNITLEIPSTREVTDEIRNLYQDVNLALQKIQTQVHEDYMKQMSIQDAQLNMLQSQMNPHFLYNTLDSIKWMANGSGQKDISRMILALSRLMRHNLGEQRSRLPLKDDLIFLEEYLYIQKIRFQEKLNVELSIDPLVGDCPVIPFLIQPLIENSIKYGVEEGPGSISVKVNIQQRGSNLEIRVEDNGPGYPEEIIKNFPYININRQEGRLGLPNLEKRMSIYYKGLASLTIYNLEGSGSGSLIILPMEVES